MKTIITIFFIILLTNPALLSAEPRSFSITVVGVESHDSRLVAIKEAISFWNQELEKQGVSIRLGPISYVNNPNLGNAIRQLSEASDIEQKRKIALKFRHIPGDIIIIIILSERDMVSFAMNLTDRKGLIEIHRPDTLPLSLPNVTRNVVAHEIGHILGLSHNSEPTELMCGRPASCRPSIYASDKDFFFPLTQADRKVLMALH